MKITYYVFDCNHTFFGGHSRLLKAFYSHNAALEYQRNMRDEDIPCDARILIKDEDAMAAMYLEHELSTAGIYFGESYSYIY